MTRDRALLERLLHHLEITGALKSPASDYRAAIDIVLNRERVNLLESR